MAESVTFQDLENADSTAPRKPFFAIDINNEDEVYTWLKTELNYLQNDAQQRLEKTKNNYLRYKGVQYMNQVYQPRDVPETRKKYMPQIVMPMISDAIDEKTARLMELKPDVVVMPTNDETSDKIDAKVAKQFLKSIDYAQKLDGKFRKVVKSSKIAGESFLYTVWDPDAGDKIKGTNQPQGDVVVKHKTVNYVFYEKQMTFEDANYCFVIELEYTEGLKRDYPEKAGDIYEDSELMLYDYQRVEERPIYGMTKKIHFYHKKTKFLPDGYEACFTKNVLLKRSPLSYQHGELPIDRIVDVLNEEEQHGEAQIEKTRAMASAANNVLNAIVKQIMLAGWAKWFVEAGSIDEQQLNNDISIVKVKQGASKPVLAQANPVGAGSFEFLDKMKEFFYQFSKSNSVIRGEPPAGITAFVALQYTSESESRRLNNDVAAVNELVVKVYDKILKTAAQFYKPEDERTMLIMGKDNRWDRQNLNIEAIAKPYNVLLQNTSGLSDSKAMRTQQLIDLNAQFPELLPREQVLEMTGLAQGQKFIDLGSAAAKCAEDENEYIMDGKGQIDPKEYEDLITHWRVHTMAIQDLGFKQNAPPEVQMAMIEHILATEMLIQERTMKSPPFLQKVMTMCPEFPMILPTIPQPVAAPMPPPPAPPVQ